MAALLGLIALCQIALWLLIAVAVVHLGRAAIWGFTDRASLSDGAELPSDDELPTVTVQLPICNELAVAERVVRAACALDWPRDRLEVQVLDDSDDATSALLDRVVAELAAGGAQVVVLRRGDRAGWKAGNLAHGLRTARGSLVAVLDADSVPDRDLIRRLARPLLDDARLGFTQGRWSFANETANLLTRVQALILDGLLLIEQARLSSRDRPLQFNGTAGMWRRAALDAAGGWLGDGRGVSVAEDLDLSYRAELAGWRGRHLPEVIVRSDLPSTMAAFRAQQQRWIRGGAQVLRALFRRVTEGKAPRGERMAMVAHLARHARQPLVALAVVWLPVTALGPRPPLSPTGLWPVLLGLLYLAVAGYYGAARFRAGRSPAPALFYAPVVIALSIGISLFATVAFLRGLAGRPAAFVRTPKGGGYRATVDALAVVEVAIGIAYLGFASLAALRGDYATALGFAFLVAAGYLWVGVGSLVDR